MESPAVGVAYSGGTDSTALLWVTARVAQSLGLRVLALHVHHGLLPDADAWEAHARATVASLAESGLPVALEVARLSGRPEAGDSVEAWARRGRYQALTRMALASGVDLILLGQHAQDQAETVLLQALRGAGPAGLAAMPRLQVRGGVAWARPWVGQPKSRVQAVLLESGLPAVRDPSNHDPRYARSRLRQWVWPELERQFPQTTAVLGEVARHAAQARALADEVAAQDLPLCTSADGGLRYSPWAALPSARRRNALTAWLVPQLPDGVPVSLVDRLMAQWQGLGRRWPAPGGWLRSQRGVLRLEPSLAAK